MAFRIGQEVKMTKDAIDNYGDKYSEQVFIIESRANKYMNAKDFFAQGKPDGYHPGYDEGISPMWLYDLNYPNGDYLGFSLYEYELTSI